MTKALLALSLGSLASLVVYPGRVTKVYDGDTFTVDLTIRPGLIETEHVRLDCGNAAELRAPGGPEAQKALSSALDGGVHVVTEWKREKYGRLLGRPLVDGRDVCADLRDAGVLR